MKAEIVASQPNKPLVKSPVHVPHHQVTSLACPGGVQSVLHREVTSRGLWVWEHQAQLRKRVPSENRAQTEVKCPEQGPLTQLWEPWRPCFI